MNKELKFRIWDGKKLDYSDSLSYIGLETKSANFQLFSKLSVQFNLPIANKNYDNCIIQQFTGLLDKNDKEIYEGDILQIPDKEVGKSCIWKPYGHVWYSDFTGSWVVSYNHLYSEVSEDLYHRIYDSFIVGNIFENPELLKNE